MHPASFGPVFYADDPRAAVLGRHPDGKAALVARDCGSWKSIYCAVPVMDAALLRGAAKYANVHLYADENLVMDADNRLVMVHNGFENRRQVTLRLPEKRTVRNARTGDLVGRELDTIQTFLERGDTQLFILE